MKLTQLVGLTFTASPNTTQAISVPFKVKYLKVRTASYDAGTNGTTDNVAIFSSLTNNSPLALLCQDTTYNTVSLQDISYEFFAPQVIQGTYNFSLKYPSGTVGKTSNAGAATDYVGLIIEFYSEEEML